jgi:anti-sigma regulatory factor (Ser/Thr protein kinase)
MENAMLSVGEEQEIIAMMTSALEAEGYSATISVYFEEIGSGKNANLVIKLALSNNAADIPLVAAHLAHIVATDIVKRQAIELALDEALTNAMFHGNLDIPSQLKEQDFSAFYELAVRRLIEEPYASRRVEVIFSFDEKLAVFSIVDQGRGFDWRGYMDAEPDGEAAYGRGLLIIRTLASAVSYNDKGNRVTLVFDREDRRQAPVTA